MEKYVPTMNNVKIQGGVREQGVEGGRCFMFTLPWLDINRSTFYQNGLVFTLRKVPNGKIKLVLARLE